MKAQYIKVHEIHNNIQQSIEKDKLWGWAKSEKIQDDWKEATDNVQMHVNGFSQSFLNKDLAVIKKQYDKNWLHELASFNDKFRAPLAAWEAYTCKLNRMHLSWLKT